MHLYLEARILQEDVAFTAWPSKAFMQDLEFESFKDKAEFLEPAFPISNIYIFKESL